jgi:hypothetical protein
VASDDALEGFPRSPHRTVFVQRVDGVLAASRMKPALPAEEWTERDPVKKDELDQDPPHTSDA